MLSMYCFNRGADLQLSYTLDDCEKKQAAIFFHSALEVDFEYLISIFSVATLLVFQLFLKKYSKITFIRLVFVFF